MEEKIKKVNLSLVGINGNAFSILGAFRRQTKKENWTDDEINLVIKKAQSEDHNNLTSVISKHCKNYGF